MLLMGPAVLLLSPHALHYEIAIAAIPLAALVDLDKDWKITGAFLAIAALMILTFARAAVPLSPILIYSVGAFVLVYILTGDRTSHLKPGPPPHDLKSEV